MKKLLALLLAMLLLAAAAGAESMTTTLTFTDLKLVNTEGGKSATTRFPDLRIEGAIGMSEFTPSIQLTFINGEEQQLGAIVQLSGTDLLASVGSVSSVFALSLEKVTGDAGSAGVAAAAIGSTISLGGISLLGVIQALTTEAEDGARVARVDVPTERFTAALDRALAKAEGLEAAGAIDLSAIRARLEGLGDTVQLEVRYDAGNGDISLTLAQDGRSVQLAGTVQLAAAPFTFADIDLEAERIDVTNFTDADIALLNDELSLMAGRLINYAAAVGLAK